MDRKTLTDDIREALYEAIRTPIVNVRIELRLPAEADHKLSQVEYEIWLRIQKVLGFRRS